MNFLPDVYVECEECHGKRYNRETLEVKYNGKTVSDILDMPISEAAKFFKAYPSISRYLDTLVDVGLGYIRLGQPATTLSGGESQRVKLATELQRRSTGKTVYILDEPTTGLHFEDVNKLLLVLQGLVDKGNTVIIIEHNLDVVKSCDWIIDLEPRAAMEAARSSPRERQSIWSHAKGLGQADSLHRCSNGHRATCTNNTLPHLTHCRQSLTATSDKGRHAYFRAPCARNLEASCR